MGVVFAGHALRLGLGLISSAILARGLGPAGLSLFSVIGAVMMIGGTIADFGLSNSGVRHIAGDLAQSKEQAQRTASVYTRLKVLGTLLVVGVILAFAGPIATLIDIPRNTGPFLVRIAALGLLATGLSGSVGTVLRALHRFKSLVATQISNIVLTILLMGFLFLAGRLDVPSALIVGIITAFAAAGLGFVLLPGDWRHAVVSRVGRLREDGRHLLQLSKWLWISAILSILLSQLDLLLLNRHLAPGTVGIYALALNLAFKADIINQTLHTVLLPTVSRLSTGAAFRRHIRRSFIRSALLAIGIIVLTPLAQPFILTVYGPAYAPSVTVFYALLSIVVFDLVTVPILLLAFPLDIPHLIVASDAAAVLILFLLGTWLIPLWGVYGAVVAKLTAKVGGALILGAAIALHLRNEHPIPHADSREAAS